MRKLLPVIALIAVASAAILAVSSAHAAPIAQAQLASTDAGSTQTVQLSPRITYCVQGKYSNTCIVFGAWDGGTGVLPDAGISGLAADCTKDFIIPIGPSNAPAGTQANTFCFDSADNTAMAAGNLDAGPANVNLFKLKKNVSNAYGPSTTP